MVFIVTPKAFAAVIKSAKGVVDPKDYHAVSHRVHFRAVQNPSGAWTARFLTSDGRRVHEDVVRILDVPDPSGPTSGSFDVPRLLPKGPVAIEASERGVDVRFDYTTFTSAPLRAAGESKDPVRFLDENVERIKSAAAKKDRRTSVCVDPAYLAAALSGFLPRTAVRLDVGGPADPVIVTGSAMDGHMLHIVLPRRSSVTDEAYREMLAGGATADPQQALPGNP